MPDLRMLEVKVGNDEEFQETSQGEAGVPGNVGVPAW